MEDRGCRYFSVSLDVGFGFAPFLNSTVECDNTDTVFHPSRASGYTLGNVNTREKTISKRCTGVQETEELGQHMKECMKECMKEESTNHSTNLAL